MIKLMTRMALAGGIISALTGAVMAAPLSPSDRGHFKTMERHESRDAQTGNYAPHGTLTPQQRALGREAWGSKELPQIPVNRPSADFPS